MKKLAICLFFFCCCSALPALGQPSPSNAPADAYKPTLDRLQALVTVPLPEWRFHGDVPHPEDAGVNDADWPTIKVRDEWQTGARVLRRWIEIPEKINGYATQGARAELNLVIRSDDAIILTVFSNGGIVYRGDEDMQQPIVLTENAQPGQKFLVAVRVDCSAVKTSIFESGLTIHPPSNRPDPSFTRMEMLSAQPMIGAYEDGKAEREQQFDAAVKSIDFTPLEHGDQAAFDAIIKRSPGETGGSQALAAAIHHSHRRQFSYRHGLAVAVDGNGGSGAQYVSKRARSDARVSGLQVHHVVGARL